MSLEKIVRPVQNNAVFTARRIVPTLNFTGNPISTDVPVLTWSGTNPGTYDEVPSDLQIIGLDVKWPEDKAQRVTESVRVENPDDSSQFVMVDRIKSTTFRNSQTGQSFNLQFADWDKDRK